MTVHNLPHFRSSFYQLHSWSSCPSSSQVWLYLHNCDLWLNFSTWNPFNLCWSLRLEAWSIAKISYSISISKKEVNKYIDKGPLKMKKKKNKKRVHKLSETGNQTPGPRLSWQVSRLRWSMSCDLRSFIRLIIPFP